MHTISWTFDAFNLISLHIRSMWETICDAWACWSGWKFGPNSTEYPYSPRQLQNTPPPWKLKFSQMLGFWVFSITEYPPPRKLKFSQMLGLWVFSITEYPPPQKKNLKFRQILGLWVFSVTEYPPPHTRSSQWETMCSKLPHVETLSNMDNYSFF